MGCCSSSEYIPQGPPPRAEPPRREHLVWFNSTHIQGIPVSRIEDSLKTAGDHLKRQGHQITVVAAGGIVDIWRLKQQHAVHDLAFFNFNLTQPEKDALKEAMEIGEKTYDAPIAKACFDQAVIRDMGRELEKILTDDSLQGNRTLFEAGGLRVIACEAMYSFITKVNRLDTPDERDYDLGDAVGHMRGMIQSSPSISRIPIQTISQYCQKYKKAMPSQRQFQRVDYEYMARYKFSGIAA